MTIPSNEHPEDVSRQALSREAEGRLDEAIDLHRRALALEPGQSNYLYRLGAALCKCGQADEGLSLMKAAYGRDPACVHFRAFLAQALVAHRAPEQALQEYEEVAAWAGPHAESDLFGAKHLLAAQRPDLAFKAAGAAWGPRCAGFEVDENLELPPSVVMARVGQGAFSIVFSPRFSFRWLLVDRLAQFLGYLDRAARDATRSLMCLWSLDDSPQGDAVQLCFSGRDANHVLIPDSSFMQTNAYSAIGAELKATEPAWEEREAIAYWRGSLTGCAGNWTSLLRLPRVELCLMSLADPRLDAKFAQGTFAQYPNYEPYLTETFETLGIVSERASELDNRRYKYLIDIDGNTNSWPGLFIKLRAAGVVIKLKSPFSQWYYGRLKDRENHVAIDRLRADLPAAIERLRSDDRGARAIGAAARALAEQLTVESEYPVFLAALERASA